MDERNALGVVEGVGVPETLDQLGSARQEQRRAPQVTLDAIPLVTPRRPEIVEQPGGDREERQLPRAKEDVPELPRLGVPDGEVVLEELRLAEEAPGQGTQETVEDQATRAPGRAPARQPTTPRSCLRYRRVGRRC